MRNVRKDVLTKSEAHTITGSDNKMKTIRTKVYQFSELSDSAKQTAIEQFSDINVDYGWWESIYEDAATIGLKLTGFDLDRGRSIDGDFINSARDAADLIIENHGDKCKTYEIAKAFITQLTLLGVTFQLQGKTDTDFFDEQNIGELEEQFKKDILNAYWKLLYEDYEHLQTDESIKDTIIANEYEFTAGGKRFAV